VCVHPLVRAHKRIKATWDLDYLHTVLAILYK
jgi:hypothetical protein